MFHLKNVINRYGTKIKYALRGVFFVAMIAAINTYVNYKEVVKSIDTVKDRTKVVQMEMDYAQNFQKKYLSSDYGYKFLAHDNSMIFRNEEIVLFRSSSDVVETGFNADLSHIPYRPTEEEQRKSMTPAASWNLYLGQVRSRIK